MNLYQPRFLQHSSRKHQQSAPHLRKISFNNINPFTLGSAKSKIDKIKKWVKLNNKQNHSQVLLNGFPMNDHTLGFCSQNQKLGNFVSPTISLWESKG